MKTFTELLNILDSIGPAIVIVFISLHRKKLSPEMIVIAVFCLVQFVCNSVATIIDWSGTNNYWVYKVNFTVSFLILLFLFAKKLMHIKPVIVYFIILVYFALSVFLIKEGDGISYFCSISAAFESIVITSFCLYFFYSKLINTSEEISIPETSIFWCVVGIFTYYAGAFFIFISYKYLINSDSSTVAVLWRFHNVLLFVCMGYISYGVLCKNYRTILS